MDRTVLSFHISRFTMHFIKLINKKFRNIFDGRVSIKIDLTSHELIYFSWDKINIDKIDMLCWTSVDAEIAWLLINWYKNTLDTSIKKEEKERNKWTITNS